MLWHNKEFEGERSMIFASDLDRTLIYSTRFIQEMNKNQLILMETLDNREISYMTKDAFNKLKSISDKIMFIPVTTRTEKQYKRIFKLKDINPKYAIVSNGGKILINGEIDKDWEKIIYNKMKNECEDISVIKNNFKEKNLNWVLRGYDAENLFLYYIVDEDKVDTSMLNDFSRYLEKVNWNMSLQGRKLYFVPKCINKWSPIEYIKEKEKIQKVFASGDSLLDLPLVTRANYSIAPIHGEIYKSYDKINTIEFTREKGILCAKEIIEKVELKLI